MSALDRHDVPALHCVVMMVSTVLVPLLHAPWLPLVHLPLGRLRRLQVPLLRRLRRLRVPLQNHLTLQLGWV